MSVYDLIVQSEPDGIAQYQSECAQMKVYGPCLQCTDDPVELYVQAAVTKKSFYDPIILEIVGTLKAEGINVELSLPTDLKHFGRIMEKVCKLNISPYIFQPCPCLPNLGEY